MSEVLKHDHFISDPSSNNQDTEDPPKQLAASRGKNKNKNAPRSYSAECIHAKVCADLQKLGRIHSAEYDRGAFLFFFFPRLADSYFGGSSVS